LRRRKRTRVDPDSLVTVLSLVRSGQASTRREIERLSGLRRAVVADRVVELIKRGLVEEGALATSTGGRAPRQIRLRAAAGHVLVGLLGTTTLGVGVADLSGRLVVEHHEPGDITSGPERTIERLDELFDWMLDEHPVAREIWGIQLAVSGLVGLAGGRLDARPVIHVMPEWRYFPLADHLRERYRCEVWVDNAVHLMALGELRAGRGRGRDDLVFVKLGTRISAGLCAQGQIHRGAHGYAGDIGHVVVSDDPIICRCGNLGCLDAVAGGAAIARDAIEGARSGASPFLANLLASGRPIRPVEVATAAHCGDPFSVELLTRVGRLVGRTLATVVNAVNPSLVIVGGGVAQAGEVLIAAIRDGLYRHSRSMATQDLQVVRSEMGKTAGLVGGALAAVDQLLGPAAFRRWVDAGSPRRQIDGVTRPGPSGPARVPALDEARGGAGSLVRGAAERR
jgi:predicted NBD/HSP70 family sugar kinase